MEYLEARKTKVGRYGWHAMKQKPLWPAQLDQLLDRWIGTALVNNPRRYG